MAVGHIQACLSYHQIAYVFVIVFVCDEDDDDDVGAMVLKTRATSNGVSLCGTMKLLENNCKTPYTQ